MLRKILAPEMLFLLGTLQAISPYLLWSFQGLNPSYHYEVTYLPLIIWGTGYICFWIGTKIVKNSRFLQAQSIVHISLNDLKIITIFFIFISIIQIILAIRLYGVLPIYGYITGTSNVFEINDIQHESGFGQLGLFSLSLFFVNGLLLIWLFKLNEANAKINFIFLCLLLIEIFGGLMAGKRQGLLITMMFLLCGFSIYSDRPLKQILKIFYIPTSKVMRIVIPGFSLFLIVLFMGVLSSVRTGNDSQLSGFEDILNYLQYPLINLESQCQQIGLEPNKYNFLYPLLSLLPNKVYEGLQAIDLPIRPEPSIGAGFYGNLHWGIGIIGVVIYSILFGSISKYFYKKSFTSLSHLLVYCQISWTLLSAHTYNHFLNLIFLPVPGIIFALFCYVFNKNKDGITI